LTNYFDLRRKYGQTLFLLKIFDNYFKIFILDYHSIKEAYIAKIKRTKTKMIKQSIFQLQIFRYQELSIGGVSISKWMI